MLDIEQAIREVGTVYQALTGRPIESGRSDLPPDVDTRAHVEDRYRHFKSILAAPGAAPFTPAWAPSLEVIERETEVRYDIDLPAVGRDRVGVSILGAFLVVRGRRDGGLAQGAAVRYSDRPTGPFQRVIALPERARKDGIQASLRDGVLAITVPTDGPGGAVLDVQVR